jgi:beta-phosphoglucomutase family hydrolase
MSARERGRTNVLGLPLGIRACLFDLDGVLTDTAATHAAAWKELFDAVLRERSAHTGTPFHPFDLTSDYRQYIDGKQRADGVRSFLASRGITLPEGTPDDAPTLETIHGLGNRKNERLLARIAREGVRAYEGSVRYVRAARDAGLRTAVVSASSNCRQVLEATGIADLFDVRIDGIAAARERLRGKPAPDTFLAAARALDVSAEEAAVFEDALAGVKAAQAGGFGFVVGIDRDGTGHALRAEGADVVVADLSELLAG